MSLNEHKSEVTVVVVATAAAMLSPRVRTVISSGVAVAGDAISTAAHGAVESARNMVGRPPGHPPHGDDDDD
jgi:hypothetical protein